MNHSYEKRAEGFLQAINPGVQITFENTSPCLHGLVNLIGQLEKISTQTTSEKTKAVASKQLLNLKGTVVAYRALCSKQESPSERVLQALKELESTYGKVVKTLQFGSR